MMKADGGFTNIVNIAKMKDEELLGQRQGIITRFRRAMKRLVVLKRFSDLVGCKFDAANFDISKISMYYKL